MSAQQSSSSKSGMCEDPFVLHVDRQVADFLVKKYGSKPVLPDEKTKRRKKKSSKKPHETLVGHVLTVPPRATKPTKSTMKPDGKDEEDLLHIFSNLSVDLPVSHGNRSLNEAFEQHLRQELIQKYVERDAEEVESKLMADMLVLLEDREQRMNEFIQRLRVQQEALAVERQAKLETLRARLGVEEVLSPVSAEEYRRIDEDLTTKALQRMKAKSSTEQRRKEVSRTTQGIPSSTMPKPFSQVAENQASAAFPPSATIATTRQASLEGENAPPAQSAQKPASLTLQTVTKTSGGISTPVLPLQPLSQSQVFQTQLQLPAQTSNSASAPLPHTPLAFVQPSLPVQSRISISSAGLISTQSVQTPPVASGQPSLPLQGQIPISSAGLVSTPTLQAPPVASVQSSLPDQGQIPISSADLVSPPSLQTPPVALGQPSLPVQGQIPISSAGLVFTPSLQTPPVASGQPSLPVQGQIPISSAGLVFTPSLQTPPVASGQPSLPVQGQIPIPSAGLVSPQSVQTPPVASGQQSLPAQLLKATTNKPELSSDSAPLSAKPAQQVQKPPSPFNEASTKIESTPQTPSGERVIVHRQIDANVQKRIRQILDQLNMDMEAINMFKNSVPLQYQMHFTEHIQIYSDLKNEVTSILRGVRIQAEELKRAEDVFRLSEEVVKIAVAVKANLIRLGVPVRESTELVPGAPRTPRSSHPTTTVSGPAILSLENAAVGTFFYQLLSTKKELSLSDAIFTEADKAEVFLRLFMDHIRPLRQDPTQTDFVKSLEIEISQRISRLGSDPGQTERTINFMTQLLHGNRVSIHPITPRRGGHGDTGAHLCLHEVEPSMSVDLAWFFLCKVCARIGESALFGSQNWRSTHQTVQCIATLLATFPQYQALFVTYMLAKHPQLSGHDNDVEELEPVRGCARLYGLVATFTLHQHCPSPWLLNKAHLWRLLAHTCNLVAKRPPKSRHFTPAVGEVLSGLLEAAGDAFLSSYNCQALKLFRVLRSFIPNMHQVHSITFVELDSILSLLM